MDFLHQTPKFFINSPQYAKEEVGLKPIFSLSFWLITYLLLIAMFMKTPCYLKKSLLSVIFCLFLFGINAQNSAIYTQANLAYKNAMNLYEEGIVGLAQTEFKKVFETLRPINEPELVSAKRRFMDGDT